MNTRNYASENCKQGEEGWIRREILQGFFESSTVLFRINANTLPILEAFPYLGRTIAYNNSDWPEVFQNLKKARSR